MDSANVQFPLPFNTHFSMMSTVVQLMNLASESYHGAEIIDESAFLDCDSVQFYLTTRNNPVGNSQTCMNQTELPFDGIFNASKPTKILVHGWMNSRNTEFTTNITRSFLDTSDDNVIQVDWSKEARKDYFAARSKVPAVARTVAGLIRRLVDQFELKLGDVHLVGHSLGSQIVGIVGYQFKAPNQIARVTGLDPAGILFWNTGVDGRISKESGAFVVVLHTCMGLLGTTVESGHVDFYPNGGTPSQPGCGLEDDFLGTCSHERAILLYSESLENPYSLKGTKCISSTFYNLGFCSANPTTFFNGEVDVRARGKYYFKTASSYPYSLLT